MTEKKASTYILVESVTFFLLFKLYMLLLYLNFPYFTASAWFHNMLPAHLQQKDLLDVLPDSETFAIEKLMPALAKGGFISDAERQRTVARNFLQPQQPQHGNPYDRIPEIVDQE